MIRSPDLPSPKVCVKAQKAEEDAAKLAKIIALKEQAEKRNKNLESSELERLQAERRKHEEDLASRRQKAIEARKAQQDNAAQKANETANSLLNISEKDYSSGKTVEEFEKYGMLITRIIVVDKGAVKVYLKVVHSWGEAFYFKNSQCISGNLFTIEVNKY